MNLNFEIPLSILVDDEDEIYNIPVQKEIEHVCKLYIILIKFNTLTNI